MYYTKRNYFDVNIIKSIEAYPDENSCKLHLKVVIERQGNHVRSMVERNIIGWNPNDSGNAVILDSGQCY